MATVSTTQEEKLTALTQDTKDFISRNQEVFDRLHPPGSKDVLHGDVIRFVELISGRTPTSQDIVRALETQEQSKAEALHAEAKLCCEADELLMKWNSLLLDVQAEHEMKATIGAADLKNTPWG